MFDFFKNKDPVCGMVEQKGKGVTMNNKWFCSEACQKKYEQGQKKEGKKEQKQCCCS